MVYPNLKVIFPHIVKTGGSTLEYHMGQVAEPEIFARHKHEKNKMGFLNAVYTKNKIENVKGRGNIHRFAKQYKQHLGKAYDEYYVFTIVRNPFSQIKSLFTMDKEFWTKKAKRSGQPLNFPSWEDYIMGEGKICLYNNRHFLDQKGLVSESGKIIVDEIFPFEYLNDVFSKLGKKFGFKPNMEVKMWSTKPQYEYTPDMCERVLDIYQNSYDLWKKVKLHWEKTGRPYNGRK